jgi:hypothetical protein
MNWVFISHKTAFFMVTAVKPSNLTSRMQFVKGGISVAVSVYSLQLLLDPSLSLRFIGQWSTEMERGRWVRVGAGD